MFVSACVDEESGVVLQALRAAVAAGGEGDGTVVHSPPDQHGPGQGEHEHETDHGSPAPGDAPVVLHQRGNLRLQVSASQYQFKTLCCQCGLIVCKVLVRVGGFFLTIVKWDQKTGNHHR